MRHRGSSVRTAARRARRPWRGITETLGKPCLWAVLGTVVLAATAGSPAAAAPVEIARTTTLGHPIALSASAAPDSPVQLSADGAVYLAHPGALEVFRARAGLAPQRIARFSDISSAGDGMGDGVNSTDITTFLVSSSRSVVGVLNSYGGYRGSGIDHADASLIASPLAESSSAPVRLPACTDLRTQAEQGSALDGDLVAYISCDSPRGLAVRDLGTSPPTPLASLRPGTNQLVTSAKLAGGVVAYQEIPAPGAPSATGSQTIVYDLTGARELYRVPGGDLKEFAVERDGTLLRVGPGCVASVFTQAQPAGRPLPLSVCHVAGLARDRLVYRDSGGRVLWSDLGAAAPHQIAAAASAASSDGQRFALALPECADYRIVVGAIQEAVADEHPNCPLSLGRSARLRGRAIDVPVRCPNGCQVAVDLSIPRGRYRSAKRLRRDLRLASSSAVLKLGGRSGVRVALTKGDRKTLRRLGVRRLKVELIPHNPAGSPPRLRQMVALTR